MKKKYVIPVNFTTTITVNVDNDDLDDAMADAEYEASKVFATMMAEGSLFPRDFIAEAQEP